MTDYAFLSLSLSVYHPVSCSYCRGNSMTGFRYRCLRCRGYQLCQNCFWRGNASGSHSNQHQMKEHSSWVRHCVITHSSHQGALRVFVLSWTSFLNRTIIHFWVLGEVRRNMTWHFVWSSLLQRDVLQLKLESWLVNWIKSRQRIYVFNISKTCDYPSINPDKESVARGVFPPKYFEYFAHYDVFMSKNRKRNITIP